MKPKYELGEILRQHHNDIENSKFNAWQKRTLYALSRCRTAQMGGHIDRCNHQNCGKLHLSYNSCRNRHCPKCQGHQRELWIQKREEELLCVGYYHVVFTLPSELNTLTLYQPRLVYSTLFKTAWMVISGFGKNPKFLGAKTAMIAILHTWGSNMSLHPHSHCIVPCGSVSKKGKWKYAKKKDNFLFPVKQMSIVFRAKFVEELRKKGIKNNKLYDALFQKDWVIYAKKPFANPSAVVEYLGRYTHKIAISNHRIINTSKKAVSFKVKNYRKNGNQEIQTLKTKEFIGRFALHILPKGFVRIRHFGFLSSTSKQCYLKELQEQLGKPIIKKKRLETLHLKCPSCKKGNLKTVCVFNGRAPPKHWIDQLKNQKTAKKIKC